MNLLVGCFVCGLASTSVAAKDAARPLITEVLANVPQGVEGDASGDGTRDAVGDEFVEIHNPFDRPINLEGYVIEDGHPKSESSRWRFTFPAARLEPGQCAVVFNGVGTKVAGPVGTEKRAAGPNNRFGGALVFVSNNKSSRTGMANKGDWVMLREPSGKGVHAVVWGEPDTRPPGGVPTDESEDAWGESYALESLDADGFVPHTELTAGGREGVLFSPGQFP